MPTFRRHLPLAIATALLVAIPASAQKSAVETQVWIDVATHDLVGMPDMGPVSGIARAMTARGRPRGYPQSRNIPADTGNILDIAMHNTLRPGVAAEQLVPAGLGVGKSIPLLPPPPGERSEGGEDSTLPEVEVTLHQYWGCGATVRPGQPKTMTLRIKGGKVGVDGSIARGQYVPDRDIDSDPKYALWPNKKNSGRPSDGSSMVGEHRITGPGVPESLVFKLGPEADFMPGIQLETQGETSDSIMTRWQPVDRARAYFLQAVAMQDEHNYVFWSSAEVPGAGFELVNYLTGSYIDKWLKQKVLLAPATTSCAIPKGIFAAKQQSGEERGVAGLNMIAYGPETNITWPPRPTDPKQPWDPEWNVRVRTKATATAVLGVDFSGMEGAQPDGERGEQKPEEGKGKKLLRGLLRSF